jgi:hypothetical protein
MTNENETRISIAVPKSPEEYRLPNPHPSIAWVGGPIGPVPDAIDSLTSVTAMIDKLLVLIERGEELRGSIGDIQDKLETLISDLQKVLSSPASILSEGESHDR